MAVPAPALEKDVTQCIIVVFIVWTVRRLYHVLKKQRVLRTLIRDINLLEVNICIELYVSYIEAPTCIPGRLSLVQGEED